MLKTPITLVMAAVAGATAGSLAFVIASTASGNSSNWLAELAYGAFIGIWPALAICFGVGAPTVALLRKLPAPLPAYPICGLTLTALLAIAGHAYFNSAGGEQFVGLMFIGAQQFWLPSALAGGAVVTAVITVAERMQVKA